MILNLPACIRTNSENVIICGLWVGPTKPIANLLLDPVVNLFQTLSSSGLRIDTSVGLVTFHAKLVIAIFDLPAKAAMLCAKQFNGQYGCSVCVHLGTRLSNNARVYLPSPIYPERTH